MGTSFQQPDEGVSMMLGCLSEQAGPALITWYEAPVPFQEPVSVWVPLRVGGLLPSLIYLET